MMVTSKCLPFPRLLSESLIHFAVQELIQINAVNKNKREKNHSNRFFRTRTQNSKKCMKSLFRILFSSNQIWFYEQVCNILIHQHKHKNATFTIDINFDYDFIYLELFDHSQNWIPIRNRWLLDWQLTRCFRLNSHMTIDL